MKYFNNLIDAIGNTPLIKLNAIAKALKPTIFAKLEYLNPGGSMKDRIGIEMIRDGERKGLLKKGGTIVEPTSGNTGVGLAIAAAVLGYKTIFTMSEKMSKEKGEVLKAYGAEVIRCPIVEADDLRHYINVAKKVAEERGAYMPNQYFNPGNPLAHYKTTGPEIWHDTDGKITHLVSPVGTGGLISGTAKFLKERNPKIKVIGVDPKGSLLYNYFYHIKGGKPEAYKVEGPGEDFMPGALDFSVIDEMIVVNDKESFDTTRALVKKEGIFTGGSSGMTVFAALKIARKLPESATVVVILPDSGRAYVSKIYNDQWMQENGML